MYEDEPTLEEMKRAVHILPLAATLGLSPKKAGSGEYVVRCPFGKHEDKTPSCHINHHKNVFHCKGCGSGGSVLDWIMLTEKLSEALAIKRLKEEYSTVEAIGHRIEVEEKSPEPINTFEPHIQKALTLFVDFSHNNFKSKKEGTGFMLKRGIIYGEIIEDFKIGLCDGSLIQAINDPEILKSLVELSLIKKDGSASSPTGNTNGGLKEHFVGRVIFPVFDENGLIVQIYGRNLSSSGPKHMLLAGAPLAIFNPKALISSEIILCESIIDALSIMAMGHRNVAALLSANGLKDDLLEKIIASNVRKVFIAFDNDNAGNASASLLSEKLIQAKIESFRIVFDAGTDANDFLKKSENIEAAVKQFKELLENAPALKELTNTPGLYESGRVESLEKKGKEYLYKIGQRRYTIRGLDQNKSDSALKIFLRLDFTEALKHENRFHIDNNIDLFNAKTTGIFCRSAAHKLMLDERVIFSDLDSLITKLDELLKKTIEEKENQKKDNKKEFHKNLQKSFEARSYLAEPLHTVKFIEDVEKTGLVGESLNSFVLFITTFSRWMPKQLHISIQSESSAGKSTMLNRITSFIPEEDLIYLTEVSARTFYHGEKDSLVKKIIAMAESEGLLAALYPIKQLMTEGRLALATTITDPKTGEHISQIKNMDGPVMFILTAPEEEILPEQIENRCLILTLNESEEQTKRIQQMQRLLHSPEGEAIRQKSEEIADFYRHVQRELRDIEVENIYSKYLDFTSDKHRTRRDNEKYLILMDCVSVFFAFGSQTSIMTNGKVRIRTHLIHVVVTHFIVRRMFKSTLDDFAPQTRNFIEKVVLYMVHLAKEKEIDVMNLWIYRSQMREVTRLSNSRTHDHARILEENEFFITKRDPNGIAYRLRFRPDESGRPGDVLNLQSMEFLKKRASKKEREEYEAFIPYLKQIFKALDPSYTDGEY